WAHWVRTPRCAGPPGASWTRSSATRHHGSRADRNRDKSHRRTSERRIPNWYESVSRNTPGPGYPPELVWTNPRYQATDLDSWPSSRMLVTCTSAIGSGPLRSLHGAVHAFAASCDAGVPRCRAGRQPHDGVQRVQPPRPVVSGTASQGTGDG